MAETKKKHSLHVISTSYTAVATIILTQLLLLLLQSKIANSAHISKPGCTDRCGGISIPYPFGIGDSCSLSEYFQLSCNTTDNVTYTPYLYNVEILNISLSWGEARIKGPVSSQCYNTTTKKEDYDLWGMDLAGSPYLLNSEKNKFTVIGCNTLAYLHVENDKYSYLGGCVSVCDGKESLASGPCSGIGCCQTAISKGTNYIEVRFDERYNNSGVHNFSRCGYAMVMEDAGFMLDTTYITTDKLLQKGMPVVFDWAIGNTTCKEAQANQSSYACKSHLSECSNSINGLGYLCNCSEGYQGNPYLEEGCEDIDECENQNACSKPGKCRNFPGGYHCSCPFGWHSKDNNMCELNLAVIIGFCVGFFVLLFLGFGTYVVLERRSLSKVKEKYFQEHGGWILLERIKSNQGFGFTIFTKQQLDEATNNFDNANIIGHGGQGTVYKGTLNDQIVAIKKCKIVDESKKKEFGKEMLILSQINHKNIVKLLGCCLEVEVPVLVYEFIPNDTLFHYIHYRKQGSPISLPTRLRIARESAEALAYLHTSASPPIFHGDVKTANILLDQNYTAKVSDFGASILAPTNEAQFVTFVQGTCGYLDPEYVQSCQLTDKSDVYSFGVVLLELITSKPVIDFDAPGLDRGLSSRFLSAMKENKMHELLDDQIICEDDMDSITEVAQLAKQCLNMKGDERPMMKEVADILERIEKMKQHPWRQENHPDETAHLLSESSHHTEIEHTGYFSLEKRAEKSIAAR